MGHRFHPHPRLSFAERMHAGSERKSEYIECMVRLQLRIHQQSAADFPSIKLRLAARIATETNLRRV